MTWGKLLETEDLGRHPQTSRAAAHFHVQTLPRAHASTRTHASTPGRFHVQSRWPPPPGPWSSVERHTNPSVAVSHARPHGCSSTPVTRSEGASRRRLQHARSCVAVPRPSQEEAEGFPAVSGAPTPPSTPSPVCPESGRCTAQSKHRGSAEQTACTRALRPGQVSRGRWTAEATENK